MDASPRCSVVSLQLSRSHHHRQCVECVSSHAPCSQLLRRVTGAHAQCWDADQRLSYLLAQKGFLIQLASIFLCDSFIAYKRNYVLYLCLLCYNLLEASPYSFLNPWCLANSRFMMNMS